MNNHPSEGNRLQMYIEFMKFNIINLFFLAETGHAPSLRIKIYNRNALFFLAETEHAPSLRIKLFYTFAGSILNA